MNTSQAPFITQPQVNFDKIVSDELYVYFDTYVSFWVLFFLSCLGVTTDTLNGLVFVTQGFKDVVNISLMAIAVWDFVKCFCGMFHRMYGPISLFSPSAATSWKSATLPYVEYTPIFASYVVYALASYVSVERCLCVCKPFAVKVIFTPRFTLVAVIFISCVVFGAYVVIYFICEIYYAYSPSLNATVAFYRYNALYFRYEHMIMPYYKFAAILIPLASFLTLSVCSATTVYQLKKSSNFLLAIGHQNVVDKQSSGISQRDKKSPGFPKEISSLRGYPKEIRSRPGFPKEISSLRGFPNERSKS